MGEVTSQKRLNRTTRGNNPFASILHRISLFVFAAFVPFAGISSLSWAQTSPYFPEVGAAAIHQRSLDLQNPAIVMFISIGPGFEDLSTLAYLRMARGATVISVYVTNGESTPSDITGDVPFRVAGRRKDEALKAMSYIGGQACFLNLQDQGIVSTSAMLERYWQRDTLRSRLRAAIERFRPDVIVLSKDFQDDTSESIRQTMLKSCLMEILHSKRDSIGVSRDRIPSGSFQGAVQRVFLEEAADGSAKVSSNVLLTHPIWKKTYRQIGAEAERFYSSLRAHLRVWRTGRGSAYTMIYPRSTRAVKSIDGGLSFASSRLKNLSDVVSGVAKISREKGAKSALPNLSSAIDSVEFALGGKVQSLTSGERRLLLDWKSRLENLRCSLLRVNVKFEVSESTVTQAQLLYLRFKKLSGEFSRGKTEIFFLGTGPTEWIIDESMERQFPFEAPREYRVLTPRKMEFDTPTASFGLTRQTLGTKFSFIIIHRDSLRERNFQYRRDVLLRVSPRFSTEIITPVVYGVTGEQLVFRLTNFTRDGVYGETFVDDSVAFSEKKPFRLRSKDSSTLDTLILHWKESMKEGDNILELKISDEPVSRFVARRFDVSVDSTRRVALVSGIEGSPVQETLRRLRIPFSALDSTSLKSVDLSRFDIVILDRDVTAYRQDVSREFPRLSSWVRAGGHLISLPQYLSESEGALIGSGMAFRYGPGLDPESAVVTDSTDVMLLKPNKIQPGDWSGWIFARAWGSVDVKDSAKVASVAKSSDSGRSLLAKVQVGKGQITLIALDLSSQLLNIHPGAFRLLANIVSYNPRTF
jgi:hypothetical protein